MKKLSAGAKGRLEKFLKFCQARCGTKKLFQNSFEIAGGHFNQGIIKDPMRASFDRELLAALISQGVLNLENSNEEPRREIAVEGKLLNFEWLNFNAEGPPLNIEEAIHARVVIRESKGKSLIITVYAWKCEMNLNLPEINRYVW
jgi:hypothetical protein